MSLVRSAILTSRLGLRHNVSQQGLRLLPVLKLRQALDQSLHNRHQGTTSSSYSSSFPPPQQPSVSRRILSATLRYGLAGIFFTSLGIAISLFTAPGRLLATALVQPPSNAETLTDALYTPPNAAAAAINARILSHPLARSLRSNPDFSESRPHLKIPAQFRAANLTGGTLAGSGRLVVPPLMFEEKGGKSAVSIFYLGDRLCGHPGLVHGGMLATLLDEGLARCCFPALPAKVGVTASLKVDYRKPTKAGQFYVLRATTVKVEGRKAWVTGWIEDLVDEGKGEVPTRYVEAEGLFIQPRDAGRFIALST